MGAAVEHEVVAVRGALERGRFPEQPNHVGGQTAGRAEDLNVGGFPGSDRERQHHRRDSPSHVDSQDDAMQATSIQ